MANKKKTTNIKNQRKKLTKKQVQEKEINAYLIVLGIIALAVVAIVIFGLTYSYFTANIKDLNPDKKDVIIKTANLEIKYIDGNGWITDELGNKTNDSTTDFKIEPGDTITKLFSVKSTEDTNDIVPFKIVLQKLTNTLDMNIEYNKETKEVTCPSSTDAISKEVTYELYRGTAEEDISTKILYGTIPCVEGNGLMELITDYVEPTKTNYYKLVVKYENLTIDQSDTMDYGKFEALVNIIDIGENYTDENRPTIPTTKTN